MPIGRDDNGDNKPDSARLHGWTECLKKINAIGLMKTLGNQPSFVPVNAAIRFMFEFEDPFTPNNFGIRRRWHQRPSLILQ